MIYHKCCTLSLPELLFIWYYWPGRGSRGVKTVYMSLQMTAARMLIDQFSFNSGILCKGENESQNWIPLNNCQQPIIFKVKYLSLSGMVISGNVPLACFDFIFQLSPIQFLHSPSQPHRGVQAGWALTVKGQAFPSHQGGGVWSAVLYGVGTLDQA